VLATLAVAVCALAIWATWIEPASLRVATYRLALPHWPAQCSGVTVAAISDLHVGSPFNGVGKLERIVAATRESHADLVLLAGDYVIDNVLGGRFVSPEVTAKELAEIDAPLGVLAVLGNHDWWLGGDRVRAALEADGIAVLEDRALEVRHGDCSFWVAGVSDFWERPHDVAAALAQVPAGAPVVVLTHNPDAFPDVPDRVALTVAGHTHGGQVFIPFVGRPIVPSRYGERYAIGAVVESGRHLFVTPGIGTSIVPIRFLVPPEISLLTLSPAEP
jgi:predicted MPP superfamily phosphohydrolase